MTHQIFNLGDIQLQSNREIPNAKLAYQTYGGLNAARDNAIIYPTSFAATHDDAAWLIGPGSALDPDRHFIIVPNALGSGLSSSPTGAELRILETDWGHVAGEGLNEADTTAIENSISDLLRR